ncbi:S-adenosyl-L-methionine-dependent methyltransferase [Xylariaceae sp. FL0662B]|nr:S-adenosyl-L-methionine-dependent methyltransferase [Xylariaceae sp. FL0662B]
MNSSFVAACNMPAAFAICKVGIVIDPTADRKIAAEVYEARSKATTAKPTAALLELLDKRLSFSRASGILDNKSSPIPVVSCIVETYGSFLPPQCTLTCVDRAPARIEQAQRTKENALNKYPDSAWRRVDSQVLDVMDLKDISDESMRHVVAAWVYNITTDPEKCLLETRRVLEPGGVSGIATRKETQWIDAMVGMRPIKKIDPSLSPHMGSLEYTSTSGLSAELEKAGLSNLVVQQVNVDFPFGTHAEFVDLMFTKLPPLIALLEKFSEEQKANFKEMMMEEERSLGPQEPGSLKGIVLIGMGTK